MLPNNERGAVLWIDRLEAACGKLDEFFDQLPDNWQQTMPGTVGAAYAGHRAAILTRVDPYNTPDGARAAAERLLAALGNADRRCPVRPDLLEREALTRAVFDLLFDDPVTRAFRGGPAMLLLLDLLSCWAMSAPAPAQAAETLLEAWNAPQRAHLRSLVEDPETLLSTWIRRYCELATDITPVACLVGTRWMARWAELVDTKHQAIRSGVRADARGVGIGVYPRTLVRWFELEDPAEAAERQLRRTESFRSPVTPLDGVPTDLDATQWQAALVLYTDALDGPFVDPVAAVVAAAEL